MYGKYSGRSALGHQPQPLEADAESAGERGKGGGSLQAKEAAAGPRGGRRGLAAGQPPRGVWRGLCRKAGGEGACRAGETPSPAISALVSVGVSEGVPAAF